MLKALIFIILLFYIFALLQTSFLVYLNIFGIIPNLILISVILINLFQKKENYSGIIYAAVGGFFLDVFSSHLIIFEILIMVLVAIFIKLIVKSYVRIPFTAGV